MRYIVRNAYTGALVSNIGSRGWCEDVAIIMNAEIDAEVYEVAEYSQIAA